MENQHPGTPLNAHDMPCAQGCTLQTITVPGYRTVASAAYTGGYQWVTTNVPLLTMTYQVLSTPVQSLTTEYKP